MSPIYYTSGVQFVREDVRQLLPQYTLITDCLAGETAIKAKKYDYLPDPSPPSCETKEKSWRYTSYIGRAVFYNATRRTMGGLVGQVFAKDPELKIPPGLELTCKSIAGDGVSVQQQAKQALEYALAYSRAGILVDFPNTNGQGASRLELDEGTVRPTITLYRADEITNWRIKDIGADEVLTLLVLKETQQVPKDEFACEDVIWYRVLKLTDSGVTCEIWKPRTNGEGWGTVFDGVQVSGEYVRKDGPWSILGANGQPLKRIPFTFIGATSNKPTLEKPAFYDLASINVAHYRNSADYEESVFVCGQPTVVALGVTEHWLTTVLQNRIPVGSRGGFALNTGADVKMLQAEPNGLVGEAMEQKERQMIALGAKLVENEKVQRTATEVSVDASAEGSVLSSCAQNVSAAYQGALELCCDLLAIAWTEETLRFKLNDDFDLSKLSAQEIAEVMKLQLAGDLSWTEVRTILDARGLTSLDNEKAKAEIDKDAEESTKREIDAAGALAKATGENAANESSES